jgi:hypothetical protein
MLAKQQLQTLKIHAQRFKNWLETDEGKAEVLAQ